MKRICWIIPIALMVFTQLSCKDKTEVTAGKEGPAGEHKGGHENENTATFTDEQIKSIGIEVGKIEEKQLTASVRANGALRVPNQNKALINSLYSGVVKSLLIQPGDIVKKGQAIATIANPDFIRMQEEWLAIGPKMVLAEQELNRQKELNQGNAGVLKNLQAAESDLRSLTTRKAALEQQIELMGINPAHLSNGKLISVLSLRTPIGGIVSNVSVKMGSYVDVSTAVAEVIDNSQLHLDLFIYEKDLPKLKNNQHIHFTLTNNPGKEYDAQIYSLGSTFEDESKAVSVHAQVKGDKTGLIDGMNITALISLDKVTAPAVPQDAIVTYQGQDYIFMVTDGHQGAEADKGGKKGISFEKVAVAKGTSEVGYTQITLLKPVPAEAFIVIKGAFFVLAKMTNAGDGEHGH
ncbi:efflux RND transporter periplasmic adaptor subunit [Paraflavitalea soli]|uniref:Efflux RND transporter periplasmic adaptor subunit n=1 Tax=Paraflavitalea soli TaxID=2315862 RepID=A0A3B7MXW2_9BACT|nr:efflux RND transporter periplasmic adaptor subunit [Paraflavitalea soli]AXY77920.1 efflux RND transporter periplasmic adaptor subunit [Paraflavitalea soli]